MQRIGLTGGIAAGKSVAAARFAELGAVVIDHDKLAREAVAPGSAGLEEVADVFGAEMVTASGELDRPALAHVVFGDPAARARLDAVLHPIIRRLSAERDAAAAAADPGAVVVHDVPLLVEVGLAESFHLLVVVHAPDDVRVERLVTERGLTADEARHRMLAQAPEDARLAVADVVLDGAGTADELRAQVDALWARLAQERAQELAAEAT